jgi:hypothetical protein
MKFFMALAAATLFLQSPAFAAPDQREVQIGINGAYVPSSLRTDSDSVVVVSGIFQNGCYKWSHADVTVVDDFNREVKTYATVSQGMCIMVLIPYQKEIALGKLLAGKHTLKFLNGDGTYLEKTFVVE